jgi:hypothetical protein
MRRCHLRPPPPKRIIRGTHFLSFLLQDVDPRTIVRPDGLGQLKNPIILSGIKHATF